MKHLALYRFSAPLLLCLKLLLLYLILKIIFWVWNGPLENWWDHMQYSTWIALTRESLSHDLFIVSGMSALFFTAMLIIHALLPAKAYRIWTLLFLFIFGLAVLFELLDAGYFRFHRQRANLDLFFTAPDAIPGFIRSHITVSLMLAGLAVLMLTGLYTIWTQWVKNPLRNHLVWPSALFFTIITLGLFFINPGRVHPTDALQRLPAAQLPFVQNSLHHFLYSMYRNRDGYLPDHTWMNREQAVSGFPLQQAVYQPRTGSRKNIVLFIMESIPADFFEPASPYHISLPFLDSIRAHSTVFTNAYSYSHHSNKGIVAILTGTPTLTEIPIYHSAFTQMPISKPGDQLRKQGYRSHFFIGDARDGFGFAKCTGWLGFDAYHSREEIPGQENLPSHGLGLHDEYVLGHMKSVLHHEKEPFLSVFYNTSTHYPNRLPDGYQAGGLPADASPQMKTARYYDDCLRRFFQASANDSWMKNTVFIFCSDHWMYPDERQPSADPLGHFRIPLFIYAYGQVDPQRVHYPVSQLDILPTILSLAGYEQSFVASGIHLLDTMRQQSRAVMMRENQHLYQVLKEPFLLGYNLATDKREYLYRTDDPARKNRVSESPVSIDSLESALKAFLQQNSRLYRTGNIN